MGTNSSASPGAVGTLRDGVFRHPLTIHSPLGRSRYVICECMLLLTQEFFAKLLLDLEVSFMTFSKWLKYDTVDGRNPKHLPGMYKTPVTNGINYQIPKPINMGNLLKAETRIAQPDNLIKRNKFFLYMFT